MCRPRLNYYEYIYIYSLLLLQFDELAAKNVSAKWSLLSKFFV